MSESFLDGKVTLHRGDCLDVLPLLEENSVDSVVTDPPYGIGFMGREWDSFSPATVAARAERKARKTTPIPPGHGAANSRGFVEYDLSLTGNQRFQLWCETWARECLRVLKPGGHLISFSGSRTYHRMTAGIEDAGFQIRDQLAYCFGSGFPKSHNIGNGWGSALKPAWEPICLARKPLSESSIAANVLRHGTGGINVDGCRVGVGESVPGGGNGKGNYKYGDAGNYSSERAKVEPHNLGRWPANLIHDGSEEVLAGFPESGPSLGVKPGSYSQGMTKGNVNDGWRRPAHENYQEKIGGHADYGSAARFFYTAKADADDRLGSKHPTVKPCDLIQYLTRLVTPRGGLVLDPFAGTGTTGEAAFRESFRALLIEREPEYQADIVKRMSLCLSGPEERRAASVKQLPPDDLPMFGGGI